MAVTLSDAELNDALKMLKKWELRDGKLYRRVEFTNFIHAFAFMTRVALHAEKIDHHPDWSNSYNVVEFYLSTHDLGGLSARDIALAKAINRELEG
jgi:4a-hydroxytetrahydrobiopterin dehydratase